MLSLSLAASGYRVRTHLDSLTANLTDVTGTCHEQKLSDIPLSERVPVGRERNCSIGPPGMKADYHGLSSKENLALPCRNTIHPFIFLYPVLQQYPHFTNTLQHYYIIKTKHSKTCFL